VIVNCDVDDFACVHELAGDHVTFPRSFTNSDRVILNKDDRGSRASDRFPKAFSLVIQAGICDALRTEMLVKDVDAFCSRPH